MRPLALPSVVYAFLLLAAATGGCGTADHSPADHSPADRSPASAPTGLSQSTLESLQHSLASTSGYPPDAIEVLAGPAHLRISVRDRKLAESDQIARENAASMIVAAVEQDLGPSGALQAVHEISVAIVHVPPQGASADDTHVEDVLQFRKGPSGRFAHHTT